MIIIILCLIVLKIFLLGDPIPLLHNGVFMISLSSFKTNSFHFVKTFFFSSIYLYILVGVFKPAAFWANANTVNTEMPSGLKRQNYFAYGTIPNGSLGNKKIFYG